MTETNIFLYTFRRKTKALQPPDVNAFTFHGKVSVVNCKMAVFGPRGERLPRPPPLAASTASRQGRRKKNIVFLVDVQVDIRFQLLQAGE